MLQWWKVEVDYDRLDKTSSFVGDINGHSLKMLCRNIYKI